LIKILSEISTLKTVDLPLRDGSVAELLWTQQPGRLLLIFVRDAPTIA
jgi:hypothetical protein